MAHSEIGLWKFIISSLLAEKPCVLMLVTGHEGSSPGRQGFKMAINSDHLMEGSIGGGIMEHKLVELSKKMLKEVQTRSLIKLQVHREDVPRHRSGMICSGQQYNALVPIYPQQFSVIKKIINYLKGSVPARMTITSEGISIAESEEGPDFTFANSQDANWEYSERLGYKHYLHIIGGGHVSLALSELAAALDFHVSVYDDRPQLHTMDLNTHAHIKKVVDYREVSRYLTLGVSRYVIIMTFGYRTDGLVLRTLLDHDFKYLGVLGSRAKIQKLWNELEDEGFDPEKLSSIDAPAGMEISSQTPREIAISILGRIIQCKNN